MESEWERNRNFKPFHRCQRNCVWNSRECVCVYCVLYMINYAMEIFHFIRKIPLSRKHYYHIHTTYIAWNDSWKVTARIQYHYTNNMLLNGVHAIMHILHTCMHTSYWNKQELWGTTFTFKHEIYAWQTCANFPSTIFFFFRWYGAQTSACTRLPHVHIGSCVRIAVTIGFFPVHFPNNVRK